MLHGCLERPHSSQQPGPHAEHLLFILQRLDSEAVLKYHILSNMFMNEPLLKTFMRYLRIKQARQAYIRIN